MTRSRPPRPLPPRASRPPTLAVLLAADQQTPLSLRMDRALGTAPDASVAARWVGGPGAPRKVDVCLLVLSSRCTRDEALALMEAISVPIVAVAMEPALGVELLARGAAEVVPASASDAAVLEALRIMSRLAVVRRRGPRPMPRPSGSGTLPELVLVGGSTGGPAALSEMLSACAGIPTPIVVAQHMPLDYAGSFAEWLGSTTGARVVVAATALEPETIHVLDPRMDTFLTARGTLESVPAGGAAARPSIDRLFSSAAQLPGTAIFAVLLSGMGTDGARGLTALREIGALTIAQSAESCVVSSMPEAARKARAAVLSLDPASIGAQLRLWQRRERRPDDHGGRTGG